MLLFRTLIISAFLGVHTVNYSQSFIDLATAAGIDTTYGNSYYGCGTSFVDFDFDGYDDLTLGTDTGDSILFYKNNGNGTFSKLSSMVNDTSLVGSILWVDIDNDYDLDLFLCARPHEQIPGSVGQNKLYENVGNLQLVDITASSGLLIQNDDSYGASFGDFDKDGDLDLFVSNRIDQSVFYQNNGNKTFTNITNTVGIYVPPSMEPTSSDMCSVFFDFDNDGDLDLYVITDKLNVPNYLYVNNGNGHFTNLTAQYQAQAWVDGMNAGAADVDNDGWFDVYVSNTSEGNRLMYNNGGNVFLDRAAEAGIQVPQHTSWAGVFVDVDNDKDEDLYVCTEGPGFAIPWRNYLFKNNSEDGYLSFVEYDAGGLAGDSLYSFSSSTADYNKDGKMDLIVSNGNNEPFQLWTNQISSSNHSFEFTLRGDTSILASNSFGIGSRIEIYDGDSLQTRFTHCGINYLSQNSLIEHVGMRNNEVIDSIIIKWNSGTVDKHYNLSSDESYVFVEGQCLNHEYENFNTFNKYIGTNNDFTLPNNWSFGTVPKIHDRVLIDAGTSSLNLINTGVIQIKSLVLIGSVTLTNTNTFQVSNSDGPGILIKSNASFINNGIVIISNNCGEAMVVDGTFQQQGYIQISK